MKGTYWYAVDYAGTGHLFTYKPERDAGIWNGRRPAGFPRGTPGGIPKITWQDSPVVVTLEVLPCEETFRLRLSKNCGYILRKYLRFPGKKKQMIEKMKEQDCDKNKGIPERRGTASFIR